MKTKIILFLTLFLFIPLLASANIVINEVLYDPDGTDTGLEYIRLYNNGDSAVDLTGYDLNAVSGDYFAIPSFSLSQKSFVTVHWRKDGTNNQTDLHTGTSGYDANMGNTTGWVALFKNSEHTKDSITDYLEYGAGGQTYESKAVPAGIWTAGDFIPDVVEGKAIKLKTDGADNNSSNDWMEINPSITQESGSGSGQSTSGEGEITTGISNQPPVAEAGSDIIAFIDEEITFDGSKSYDPDGLDLAYEWNLGEGGVEDDVVVTHKYSYPGTYLVTLTVFDGRYYTSDTITVEIYPKKITINEFLPNPIEKEKEWIEIYNDSDQIIDISGWQLDDGEGGSNPFVFPKNTLIAPKNYLVLSRKVTGIALNNDKDKVRLLLSGGVVFQEIKYEKAPEGKSSARTPEGFVWSIPTPGLPNIINNLSNSELNKNNQPLQLEITEYSLKETAINYKKDSKEQIKGELTNSSQQESQENLSENRESNQKNLAASVGTTVKRINYKLIFIILIIIVGAAAFGIVVVKLKKRIK